jgi:hypothetical protein
MPQYSFFIWNKQGRVKYPTSLDLSDIDVAREIALRIAHVFVEVVPYWSGLSRIQREAFVIEIVDEAGQTVLTVPLTEATGSAS